MRFKPGVRVAVAVKGLEAFEDLVKRYVPLYNKAAAEHGGEFEENPDWLPVSSGQYGFMFREPPYGTDGTHMVLAPTLDPNVAAVVESNQVYSFLFPGGDQKTVSLTELETGLKELVQKWRIQGGLTWDDIFWGQMRDRGLDPFEKSRSVGKEQHSGEDWEVPSESLGDYNMVFESDPFGSNYGTQVRGISSREDRWVVQVESPVVVAEAAPPVSGEVPEGWSATDSEDKVYQLSEDKHFGAIEFSKEGYPDLEDLEEALEGWPPNVRGVQLKGPDNWWPSRTDLW